MMYLGVENKKPLGRGGGVIYFIRYLVGGGGVRCVPLDFAFIESQSFFCTPHENVTGPRTGNK